MPIIIIGMFLNAFFRVLANLSDAYKAHNDDPDIGDVYDDIEAIHDDMSSSITSPQVWDEWWYNDSAKSVAAIDDLLVNYPNDPDLLLARNGDPEDEDAKGLVWCTDELEKLV